MLKCTLVFKLYKIVPDNGSCEPKRVVLDGILSFVYDIVISVKVIDCSVYELPGCIENCRGIYLTWQ